MDRRPACEAFGYRPEGTMAMQVRVGCRLGYEVSSPTPALLQIQPREEAATHVLKSAWQASPTVRLSAFTDLYGNSCTRLIIPPGVTQLEYGAVIEIDGLPDVTVPSAAQLPVESLLGDTLHFTLPSRYCLSDELADDAWRLFGSTQPGWTRVQAICDWVHEHIRFAYGSSTPRTTAVDIYKQGVGVCRDFAHLAITFCRALNIPARYVFGYLPDIGVPAPDSPMDFCAWMEVYLADRWYTFDPRNNTRRIGHIVIGRGRDAVDVAMVTTYGTALLQNMVVWADEIVPSSEGAEM